MEFDPSISYKEFRKRHWEAQPNPQSHTIKWLDLTIDGKRFDQTMLCPKPNENYADIWYCVSAEDAKIVGMQAFNSYGDQWWATYEVSIRKFGSQQVWVKWNGMEVLEGQHVDDRKLLRKR